MVRSPNQTEKNPNRNETSRESIEPLNFSISYYMLQSCSKNPPTSFEIKPWKTDAQSSVCPGKDKVTNTEMGTNTESFCGRRDLSVQPRAEIGTAIVTGDLTQLAKTAFIPTH